MSENIKRYAVLGYPIKHSLSPPIHEHFAKQVDVAISFEICEVVPESFEEKTHSLIQAGYAGICVSSPFKECALALANKRTESTKACGSVNTLKFTKNSIEAKNTDGIGLLRALNALKIPYETKNILILGAGGAVLGILPGLIEANAQITLVNRHLERFAKIQARYAVNDLAFKTYADLNADDHFNLIIHATSAGVSSPFDLSLPPVIFQENTTCYDLQYSKSKLPTPFLQLAQESGAKRCVDGLSMLVEQAAVAFEFWYEGIKEFQLNTQETLAYMKEHL